MEAESSKVFHAKKKIKKRKDLKAYLVALHCTCEFLLFMMKSLCELCVKMCCQTEPLSFALRICSKGMPMAKGGIHFFGLLNAQKNYGTPKKPDPNFSLGSAKNYILIIFFWCIAQSNWLTFSFHF